MFFEGIPGQNLLGSRLFGCVLTGLLTVTDDHWRSFPAFGSADQGYYASAADIGAAEVDLNPDRAEVACHAAQRVAQRVGRLGASVGRVNPMSVNTLPLIVS